MIVKQRAKFDTLADGSELWWWWLLLLLLKQSVHLTWLTGRTRAGPFAAHHILEGLLVERLQGAANHLLLERYLRYEMGGGIVIVLI